MNRRDFLGKMVRTAVGVGAMGAVGVSRIASSPAGQVTAETARKLIPPAARGSKVFGGPGTWWREVPRGTPGGGWVHYDDPRIGQVYRSVVDSSGRIITEFMKVGR